MKKINDMHKRVLYFLKENESLRNDDVALQLAIIRNKYPYAFKTASDGTEYVATHTLKKFTQDNVKRIRAKIQNEEGLYLPTDPVVRKQRKIKEETWIKWLVAQNTPVKYWNDTD